MATSSKEYFRLVTPQGVPSPRETLTLLLPVPSPNPYEDFELQPFQWHNHPVLTALRVIRQGNAAEHTEGINVDLPIGGSLQYLFADFPKNSWVGIADRDYSPLPILIYIHGSLGVKGR